MKSCLLLSDQVIIQSNFITFSYCFSYDIVFYYSQRSICFLLELFAFLFPISAPFLACFEIFFDNFLHSCFQYLFLILSFFFAVAQLFHCVHLFCSLQICLFKKLFFTLFLCRTFHLIHWSCSRSFIRRVLYFLFVFHLFLIDISAFPLLTFFFTFSQNVSKRRIDFSISKWASST